MPTEKPVVAPFAEFQSIPLEYLIGAPLVAAVRAQALSTNELLAFLAQMAGKQSDFTYKQTGADGKAVTRQISVPSLALVPPPCLSIESLHVSLKFEVRQTIGVVKETAASATLEAGTGAALSPWVKASLSGTLSHKNTSTDETNRSGTYEISLQAGQAPIPEGLARVLSALVADINVTTT